MNHVSQRSHEVFISYSTDDKPSADAACAVLEGHRIRCWIAPRDILPGTEWQAEIIAGIDTCKVMVLIFSSHANASSQVRREVERAISKGLSILPFRVEDVRPAGAMEYALGNTHWLDAFTPPVERQLEILATSVQVLLGKARLEQEGPSPDISPGAVRTKLPARKASRVGPLPPSLPEGGLVRWLAVVVVLLLLAGGVAVSTMLNSDRTGKRVSQPDQPARETIAGPAAAVDTRTSAFGASPAPSATHEARPLVEPKKAGALFSATAQVGKTLYISGKGGNRPNAVFSERVEDCLNEIRKTLQSAGLDMRHVVNSFVYVEDLRGKVGELNLTYASSFPRPPRADDDRGRTGSRSVQGLRTSLG